MGRGRHCDAIDFLHDDNKSRQPGAKFRVRADHSNSLRVAAIDVANVLISTRLDEQCCTSEKCTGYLWHGVSSAANDEVERRHADACSATRAQNSEARSRRANTGLS